MAHELTKGRVMAELLVVVALGVATSAMLYSEWWHACCEVANPVVMVLLIPAMVIAIISTGGSVHSGSPVNYYLGVVVWFVIVWVAVRYLLHRCQAGSQV